MLLADVQEFLVKNDLAEDVQRVTFTLTHYEVWKYVRGPGGGKLMDKRKKDDPQPLVVCVRGEYED